MKKNIQKIYPLTPMQEGMLFHSLNGEGNDYFTQFQFTTEGELDTEVLRKTIATLSERHDIFRTAFVYDRTEKPIQVVLRNREIEFFVEDLSHQSDEEQKARMDEFLEQDRSRGFDLTKEALIRISVFKIAPARYEFIWSNHHILLDGWCLGIILKELDHIYNALANQQAIQLDTPIPFSNYVNWLEKQNAEEATRYWTNYLEGYSSIAHFPKNRTPEKNELLDQTEVKTLNLSVDRTERLKAIAKKEQITMSTLFDTLWGIVLGRYTHTQDVVYGNVVSGRPSDLEGADEMIGLFINTVPVRVRYNESTTFQQLIRTVHKDTMDAIPYHYSSLAEISAKSKIEGELIHHVVVFGNYQDASGDEDKGVLNISNVRSFEHVNYDLYLNIDIQDQMSVFLSYNPAYYTDGYIDQVLQNIEFIVDQVLDVEEIKVADLKLVNQEEWAAQQTMKTEEAEAMAFWNQQLSDLPTTNLPSGNNRRSSDQTTFAVRSEKIDATLYAQLTAFVEDQQGVVRDCLLTLFLALINRYNGQDDLCIWGPQLNADAAKSGNDQAAPYLPYRILIDNQLSFESLTGAVTKVIEAITRYDHLPFTKLMELANQNNSSPLRSLIPLQFNFQQEGSTDNVAEAQYPEYAPQFQFTVVETTEGVEVSCSYAEQQFEATYIERFLTHFKELLFAALQDASAPVQALNILSSTERQQLDLFNKTNYTYPAEQTIASLFEEQAQRNPEQTALIFKGESMSYQQLNEQANVLAAYLQQTYAIQPNDRIGLMLERSPRSIIAILGILKSGAAYVPIELKYPQERKEYIINDTQIKALIIDSDHLFDVLEFNIPVFSIDLQLSEIDTEELKPLNTDGYQATDLAYIMYTSGSTGQPKGVAIRQQSISRLVFNQEFEFLTTESTLYHFAPLAFDASTIEIWGVLLKGGTLVISAPGLKTLEDVGAEIKNEQVDTLWLTAGLFHQAVDNSIELFAGLKYIMAGGDSIRPASVAQLLQTYPGLTFINGYGPTESTTFATVKKIASANNCLGEVNNIGRPISNTQIYIFNPEITALMPQGLAGEICIGGDGLATGYLNQPALTAEKFIAHPTNQDQRLYRTGDMGRWLPSGDVEFLGRMDNQVKIRGYRIEPGEIEAALQELEAVSQCIVLVKEDPNGDKRLVAYIIPTKDYDKSSIQQGLNDRLPDFMIPSVFVRMDEFPLTTNGKVDRSALPEPDLSDLVQSTYLAPNTASEKTLVEIWKQVLNIERIGIEDDFFELGGHSLLAMRVISAIRTQFKMELSIKEFFAYTKIKELAAFIDTQESATPLPVIEAQERPEKIPLSFAQERLWFIDQMGGSVEYHIPNVLRLKGRLNIDAFKQAFNQLVNRHEVLRTVIREENGQPYQHILPEGLWSLEYIEDASMEKEEKLNTFLDQYTSRAFQLAEDHPMRVALIKDREEEYIFAVVMHHIASDAWSSTVMLEEFLKLYKAYDEDTTIDLAPLKIQYADYAIWQRAYHSGDRVQKELNFWKNKLENISTLDILTDYPRPAIQSTEGAEIKVTLSEPLAQQLLQLAATKGVTPFMFFLSAFKTLLYKYSHQTDLCIGVPIAGRTIKEVEPLIGFFVNTICLRTQFEKHTPFEEVLQAVKTTTLEGYANQMVPFEQIVDLLGVERDMSQSPVFQVMFDYLDNPDNETLNPAELQVESAYEGTVAAQRDLDLTMFKVEEGIELNMTYCTALFSEATIQQLLENLKTLLTIVAQQPEIPISQISLLTPDKETALLTQALGDTSQPLNNQDTLVSLFEKQVDQAPQSIAVGYAKAALTYQQLDEKANQLANVLLTQKQPTWTFVGLCIDDSLETLVGILGIMKAGLTYLPIDPALPSRRIDYLIEDAGIQVIVAGQKYVSLFEERAECECLNLQEVLQQEAASTVRPNLEIDNQSLAYVIYTSGSTGQPKGVEVEHRSIVNELLYVGRRYRFGEGETTLKTSSLVFDTSVEQIFLALLHGGKVALLDKEILLDGEALAKALKEDAVTHLDITPSMLKMLKPQATGHLRRIVCGGEAVPLTLAQSWLPYVDFFNAYGPTEATVSCVLFEYQGEEWVNKSGTLPIGKPYAHCRALVLDEEKNLVLPGMIGDLYIGGSGLARGYLNRPELTAEKFISSPFNAGERLYSTGDRVRWLQNGYLDFRGRVDDQVKIRGQRIELGEVEKCLLDSGQVDQAAVLVWEASNQEHYLTAYIVPADNYQQEELQALIKDELPRYMNPSFLIPVDRIPVTINGKIDRKALPTPDLSSTSEYVAPATDTEKRIARIWEELLNVEQVGVQDNFFMIGGHSLMVMRMISAIRASFGIELKIRDVFFHATVQELASRIDQQEERITLPAIERQKRTAQIPLSFAQERLWFIDQLGGSVEYHVPNVLKINGTIDPELVNHCFQTIVDRHEILRTIYLEDEGVPYQQIRPSGEWSVNFTDRFDVEGTAAIQELVDELIEAPFDLSKDHPIRVNLVKLQAEEYLFVMVMHHIACDGWSGVLLMDEFTQLYVAQSKGASAQLPELKVQYADYSIWQRTHFTKEKVEEQLNYWKVQLEGVEPLEIPTDFQRPAFQSKRGDHLSYTISPQLADRIGALAQRSSTTDFMLLLAAFKVLLSKYAGQEDICVGTPVAGRVSLEVEPLIGFFINMLPIRTRLDAELTFTELLQMVRQGTLEAYENQMIPFEQLVETTQTDRDMSRSAIFQVSFAMGDVLENEHDETVELDIDEDGFGLGTVAAQRDLSVGVNQGEDGLEIGVTYCADLYEKATVAQLLRHFENVLERVIENPNLKVGDINLLDEVEINEIAAIGFQAFEQDEEATIVSLFQQQARQTPERIALVMGEEQLTYQQLEERSDGIAQGLIASGLREKQAVGICMERSMDLIIGILGILKCGSAYIPLDPSYPTQRITQVLEDAAAQMILSSDTTKTILQPLEERYVVTTPTNCLQQAKNAGSEWRRGIQPDDLAVILFTSGTTGKPKGIQLEHAGIVNEIQYQIINFGLTKEDRVLLTANVVFDASMEQLFLALLSGARAVLIEQDTLLDKDRLEKVLDDFEITHIHSTPSLLQNLTPRPYRKLKRVLSGGEICPLSLAQSWSPYVEFYNKYGPSETTINSSVYQYDEQRLHPLKQRMPVGRPIGNTQIFILDEAMRMVPKGVIGEVYIGGKGVCRGYLNRPELNQEKFIDSPFTKGDRLYKTGDLARWQQDGQLDFRGRTDDQVKIRGQRVEIGEIEKSLLLAPQVIQAVVNCQGDKQNKTLVAYLIAGESYNKEQVIEYLRERLPEYMLPTAFVELDEFPRTVSGKIDKQKLPAVELTANVEKAFIAPRTATEQLIAKVWSNLLGIEQISVNDGFFELGGHSLMIMRVISTLRSVLNVEIEIRDLFVYTNIADLAGFIDKKQGGNSLPPIRTGMRPEKIPLSFAQERLWFIDQLQGSINYHIANVFKINGSLNRTALEKAFQTIVNRHEALRTVIREEDGIRHQVILDIDQWEITYLETYPYRDDATLSAYIDELIEQPFNLSEDHPIRLTLIQLAEDQYAMLVVTHHIATDGWSSAILIDEFSSLYAAFDSGQPITLPPLEVQYADFAIWENDNAEKGGLDVHMDYWKEKLEGVTPLELQTDLPRPTIQSYKGAHVDLKLEQELVEQLRQLATAENATLFMLMLGAFKALLHRYSLQEDICIGVPTAGRLTKELEPLIGMFVNTLPLRTELNANMSFSDLLKVVKQNTIEAYAHQKVPFEQMVENIATQRDMSRHPIFQILFTYQNTPENDGQLTDQISIEDFYEDDESNNAKADMSIGLEETAEGIDLRLTYCTDLYHAESIVRLLNHYKVLLTMIASNPAESIGRLKVFTSEEEAQMIRALDFSTTTYPRELTVVDLFEEQVRKYPEGIAIRTEEKQLTYQQLNEKANQLANLLMSRGVQAEDLIGLCLDRSPDMIIAILAVIKAGGAYLPIDPAYPQDRIHFTLQDAKVKMLITQKEYEDLLGEDAPACLLLDQEQETLNNQSKENIGLDILPDQLLYVIYTSGTTGRPKGALLEHRNVVRLFVNDEPLFDFGPEDVWTLFHSYCFDFSVWEMYGALLFGGSLVIVPKEVAKDTAAFGRLLQKEKVSVLNQTPAAFNILQEYLLPQDKDLNLRYIIFGGDALNPQHLLHWNIRYPECKLINMYGITETTVHVTYKALGDEDFQSPSSNIGVPIPTLSCYLLDQHLALMPAGAAGELYVGGAGVARGYLNRPELTAERFITNPFDPEGSRLYKTGDLARLLPNGEIEYLGRIDNQVKIHGFRIELGEIESVLENTAGVGQCVVLAKEDAEGLKRLIAYVVVQDAFDKEQILHNLKTQLPDYMVPALIMELEALPLTSNGKIDRKALPDPDASSLITNEYVAPRNETESQLTKIWTHLLNVERVGVYDQFFELGGHSLMATRVSSAIKEQFGITIPLRALFQFTCIADLSKYINVIRNIDEHESEEEFEIINL